MFDILKKVLFEEPEDGNALTRSYIRIRELELENNELHRELAIHNATSGVTEYLNDSALWLMQKEHQLVEDLEEYMRDNGLETPWIDQHLSFYVWKEQKEKEQNK